MVQVRGRYTLSDGKMKYLCQYYSTRTFNIKDGSYLEFTGDPMKPTLKNYRNGGSQEQGFCGSGEGGLLISGVWRKSYRAVP